MDKLIIKGGNKLKGKVRLSGAKNSALKVLLGALLTREKVILKNIPAEMLDVAETIRMLRLLNVKVAVKNQAVYIDSSGLNSYRIPLHGNFQIRTILLMLGVLLGRFGKARIPFPGGCRIGERKFDLHLYALRKLGAKVRVSKNYIESSCAELRGAEIEFPSRTTGGTENAILASVFAKGKTIIRNAHTRPEILDLINFLTSMGAKIRSVGSGLIEINGVAQLHGTTFEIIPDNVEALTFIIAAAVTGGDVTIMNCPYKHLEVPLVYLRESGVRFITRKNCLRVIGEKRYTPIDLSTGSYPGINSDYQPLFAVFASQTEGKSHITDIRFKDRFQYIKGLRKFETNIKRKNNSIIIDGPSKLIGNNVEALDLRAGAALIVAALCAEGTTVITNISQINRGYEQIDAKLRLLGANINKI